MKQRILTTMILGFAVLAGCQHLAMKEKAERLLTPVPAAQPVALAEDGLHFPQRWIGADESLSGVKEALAKIATESNNIRISSPNGQNNAFNYFIAKDTVVMFCSLPQRVLDEQSRMSVAVSGMRCLTANTADSGFSWDKFVGQALSRKSETYYSTKLTNSEIIYTSTPEMPLCLSALGDRLLFDEESAEDIERDDYISIYLGECLNRISSDINVIPYYSIWMRYFLGAFSRIYEREETLLEGARGEELPSEFSAIVKLFRGQQALNRRQFSDALLADMESFSAALDAGQYAIAYEAAGRAEALMKTQPSLVAAAKVFKLADGLNPQPLSDLAEEYAKKYRERRASVLECLDEDVKVNSDSFEIILSVLQWIIENNSDYKGKEHILNLALQTSLQHFEHRGPRFAHVLRAVPSPAVGDAFRSKALRELRVLAEKANHQETLDLIDGK